MAVIDARKINVTENDDHRSAPYIAPSAITFYFSIFLVYLKIPHSLNGNYLVQSLNRARGRNCKQIPLDNQIMRAQ